MTGRKLTPREAYLARRNDAVAFEGCYDFAKELEKSKTDRADPREDVWGAFTGEAGAPDPVASLFMSTHDVRFDGHVVKLGGVGGVATLPAYRRGGAIRSMMEASFRDLYDRGFLLSALYPFSTAFYRQFGFEPGCVCQYWNVPLQNLSRQDVGGKVRQLFPGDDLSPLLEVYNAYTKDLNLAALRQEYDKSLKEEDLMAQKRSIFLWEDENSRPGAFLIGGREGEALNCRTNFGAKNGLLFRDARGLTAMLSFVRKAFISNFQSIRFALPPHIDVSSLVPEITADGNSFFHNGMLRAVNARRALELCRCKGEGSLTLTLTDPLLPENNGTFRLSFAPQRDNRVEETEDRPDVTLGPGELGQLLCGVHGAEDLPWMPGASVQNPAAPLEQVFYKKPCFLTELF